MEYNAIINKNGEIEINGVLINEEIFNKEKVEYSLRDREDQIYHLGLWIEEAKNQNNRTLMIEDLKQLAKIEDTFIFSSISTNEFISKSEDEKRFNEICEEILNLNDKLRKEEIKSIKKIDKKRRTNLI